MSVEQSDADSPSILERMESALSPERPEAAVKEEPEDAQPVETTEDDEPEQEEAPPEEFAEVTADDGTPVKIPAKLKDSFLRWDDYTKKTQTVQSLAEKAQDQLHFAEAQQQLLAAVAQDIGQFHAKNAHLQRYESLDWSALWSADPGQAMKLRDERDQLRAQVAQIGQAIQAKAAHANKSASEHIEWQWQKAEEGVMQILGKVTPEENAAMARTAKALGFTDKELKGRYADAKILHAIYKAAKWDQLQAGKSAAVSGMKTVPPVLKPGAVQTGAAAERKTQDARMRLKKSGRVEDAAALFMRMK
jgi:hypothetical protein